MQRVNSCTLGLIASARWWAGLAMGCSEFPGIIFRISMLRSGTSRLCYSFCERFSLIHLDCIKFFPEQALSKKDKEKNTEPELVA